MSGEANFKLLYGQEAIDYLDGTGQFSDRSNFPIPCLLVLDLKMPRKNGMEVLAWLRTQPSIRGLPVIIFSSSAQPEDIDHAYLLGANAFVVKPPSIEKRVEFARLIKDFWLNFNKLPQIARDLVETPAPAQ